MNVQERPPSHRDKLAHKLASAFAPNLDLNLGLNLIRKSVSGLNLNLNLNLLRTPVRR
jgi:hypothetical protein